MLSKYIFNYRSENFILIISIITLFSFNPYSKCLKMNSTKNKTQYDVRSAVGQLYESK